MKTDYPYMTFTEVTNPGKKTKIWEIASKSNGGLLGRIKWYGAWRQYCFFPEPDTIFNIGCLADIDAFIHDAMRDWRKERGA